MWMPPKYMLDNQNKENNFTQVTANRRPTGHHIYIIPLTAAALALLVATASVKANNIPPYQADLNKDQIVNFQDVAQLANNWQQTGQGLEGDLNKDGVINTADLGAQVAHWLGTWTPIATVEDLNDVRNNLAGCYALVQDVNASETSTWNEGKGFEPIGNNHPFPSNPFKGALIGNGHYIINLYINRPSELNVGLFGILGSYSPFPDTSTPIISDIRLERVYILGSNSAGALAGRVENGKITRTSVSGRVESITDESGGLIGYMDKGTITDSFFEGNVTGGSFVGGVVGGGSSFDPNTPINIANCYSTGNVNGTSSIGGLIGYVYELIITNCFSTSDVNGVFRVGGLVGRNKDNSSQIIDSYFTDDSNNNQGTFEPNGPTFFHGNSHPVYATWDFNDVWLADPNNFPTLRGPEESLSDDYKVWDANDGSDSQSNNTPTQMILLKEPKDLVEITKALARKQADKVIKQILQKPIQYS